MESQHSFTFNWILRLFREKDLLKNGADIIDIITDIIEHQSPDKVRYEGKVKEKLKGVKEKKWNILEKGDQLMCSGFGT